MNRSWMMMFALMAGFLAAMPVSYGVERFPPPDFESGHVMPQQEYAAVDGAWMAAADVAVLIVALAVTSYLVLKRRSRGGVVVMTLFSLLYFGFYREGCVCSVGSIQNVALAVFDADYALPLVAGLFFIIPILFALFFGRTFCAGVCPLGAVQDLVTVKSLAIPVWLEQGLGMLRYVYLAAAVMYAAGGSAFLICEYDPFVAFFRLGGSVGMVLTGVGFLVVGMFLFRPYCRFLCPYGAVLGWFSRISRFHAKIDPDQCVQCRLCEEACPVNAIEFPSEGGLSGDELRQARVRMAVLLVLVPLWVLAGAWIGYQAGPSLARLDVTVELAEMVRLHEAGEIDRAADELQAFYGAGRKPVELYGEAAGIEKWYEVAGSLALGFVGLMVGLKLAALARQQRREDYEIEKGKCVGCARCFRYCPHDPNNLAMLEAEQASGGDELVQVRVGGGGEKGGGDA